jgi:hypothetical protein
MKRERRAVRCGKVLGRLEEGMVARLDGRGNRSFLQRNTDKLRHGKQTEIDGLKRGNIEQAK